MALTILIGKGFMVSVREADEDDVLEPISTVCHLKLFQYFVDEMIIDIQLLSSQLFCHPRPDYA